MPLGSKITVIDDSDIILRTLRNYFEKHGYIVSVAGNGEEALRVIHSESPDIVISDILMPKMTGIELLSIIKEEYPNLPFIILSSVDNIEFAIKALQLGAWDFITKTDDNIEMMRFTVENALQKAEIILENMNYKDSLEKKVEERTKQLNSAIQEIHHRVKNNLQLILSMIRLQTNYIKNPDSIKFINSFSGRIKSMALVHDQLYTYNDLGEIKLKKYISDLFLYEAQLYPIETVKTDFDVDDMTINVDMAIPLGILLNELISNSYKYAFPDMNGLISLFIKYDGGKIRVIYSDNGIGLIEKNSSKTLGLNLINSLIKQLNGEFDVSFRNGTKYEIVLNTEK